MSLFFKTPIAGIIGIIRAIPMNIYKDIMMRVILSMLVSLMFFSCTSDEEHQVETKVVDPLTVRSAQSYYNKVYDDIPKLKSSTDDLLLLIPEWSNARLYKDSLWYAVESPIEFEEGMKIMLMSDDVSNALGVRGAQDSKQVLRLVIARNKETGKTVSFIMAILPKLDYLRRKGDTINDNLYLSRTSDLSGAVLFFAIDGRLVNGWIYEDGIIAGEIFSENSKLGATKAKSSYCWTQVTEVNGQEVGRVFYCDDAGGGSGGGSDRGGSLHDALENGGGINSDYSDPAHGGSSGGSGDSSSSNKNPEKRTDCTDKAIQNGRNTNNALGNIAVKAQIESLRINGKTNNKIEFGLSISYDAGYGTYSIPGGGVWQGVPGDNNVGLSVTAHTMFTVHTHYSGLNSAPSCGDIIATVSFYKFVKESKGTYRGTIIFAANGSEYMIYVDDSTALEKFYTGLVGNDF